MGWVYHRSMSRNLRDYVKSLYTVDGVVRRVADEDWDNQSPNPDWSAKETLGHVIWGVRHMSSAVRGLKAPEDDLQLSVVGSDPMTTWTEAMDELLVALDERGVLERRISTPFGEMTVDEALGSFFADPLTHAWDIAHAVGIDAVLPEELSRKGLTILKAAGEALRGPGFMQEPIEVSEVASSADQFIAYTGRKP